MRCPIGVSVNSSIGLSVSEFLLIHLVSGLAGSPELLLMHIHLVVDLGGLLVARSINVLLSGNQLHVCILVQACRVVTEALAPLIHVGTRVEVLAQLSLILETEGTSCWVT